MIALICFVLAMLASPFKSKCRLEAENAALRHQLVVLRRKMPGRPWLTNNDRRFFLEMYRWFPSILKVVRIIQPKTQVRWHQAGFRCYCAGSHWDGEGDPQIETELRALTQPTLGRARASTANYSSSALLSLNQALQNTWSSDVGRQARDGALFCITMRRTLPPCICSSSRSLASNCFMPSSSFG